MKHNVLEYKGYTTKIEYDTEDQLLYGKIEGIRDLVDFSSDSPASVVDEFHDAVDGYLEFCNEIGKEPEKPFKGVFNVRLPSELHRELFIVAEDEQITQNKIVEKAIREYVQKEKRTQTVVIKGETSMKNVDTHYGKKSSLYEYSNLRLLEGGVH